MLEDRPDQRTDAGWTPTHGLSRRHPVWHLLWAVPLGLVGATLAWALASFDRCGVWACTTPERGDDGALALFALAAGACLAAPLWLVPWTTRAIARFCVGWGALLAVAVGVFLQVGSL